MIRLFRRHFIRYFLLFLFVSYFAGITLFMHSHVVNGVTIVHSHPYSPKNAHHGHTSVEFDLIHLLNHFTSTTATLSTIVLAFVPLYLLVLDAKLVHRQYAAPYHGLAGLRAPPYTTL